MKKIRSYSAKVYLTTWAAKAMVSTLSNFCLCVFCLCCSVLVLCMFFPWKKKKKKKKDYAVFPYVAFTFL